MPEHPTPPGRRGGSSTPVGCAFDSPSAGGLRGGSSAFLAACEAAGENVAVTEPQPVASEPQPSEPVRAPRWGLPTALGSLAGFVLASFLVPLALVGGGADPILASVVGTLVGWISLVGWPVLAARRRGNGVRADLAWSFRAKDLGIGALAAFAVFGAAVIFLLVYLRLTGELPSSAVGETAEEATEPWQVLALAVLVLCAPFAEELHFRGAWWSALRRRGLGSWLTLIVTSALFALLHLEPARLPLLFAAGFAAGLVRLVTGRLGPAIVTHFIINGVATLGLLSLL